MKWTHVGYVIAATAGATALLPLGTAHAQDQVNGFLGKWQLNMAQSKPDPRETVPANLMTQIDRMDIAHVHWTTTTTDAQGQKDVETFDNPGNGEFYSLNGYTMVSHKLSPSMVQSTYREDSGQTDVLSCTLVNNARQMTCNGVVTHLDGSTVRYTDVFDRV
jgi:hypothetical protein